MNQRFRKLALVVSVASLMGAGLIVACSSDDKSTPLPTNNVDGSTKSDGGTTNDSGGPGTGDDSGDGDGGTEGGADCSKDPVLRKTDAGIRCAFMAPDSGSICQSDQICCNTESKATGPGFCADGPKNGTDSPCVAQAPNGSTFNANKGKAWECIDKNQCGSDQICCMIQDEGRLDLDPKNKLNIGRTPSTDTKHPPACNVQRAYNEGGSRCRPTSGGCLDPELRLCSLNDDCGPNATCTPFIDFTNFVDRGYCKPNGP